MAVKRLKKIGSIIILSLLGFYKRHRNSTSRTQMYIANYENVSLFEISPFTATRLSGDMQPSAWREKTFWSCCFCSGEGLVLHMEKPLSTSGWPQVNAGWPWQHVGHFECDPAHVGPWVMLFMNVLTPLHKISVSQLTFCTLWLQTNCKITGLQVDIYFWWVVHTLKTKGSWTLFTT